MKAINLTKVDEGHEAPITGVAVRTDGTIATSSYDGTVRIWSGAGEDDLAVTHVMNHRRLVNAVSWNPARSEYLATASADKTVAVWKIRESGTELVSVLSRHTDDVNSVDWLPDGRRLVCVSEDGHVSLWDGFTAEFLGNLDSHRAHCMAVSVSIRGEIASVGEDGLVSVTRTAEPGGQNISRAYDASIEGCAWSSDGQLLALAKDDGVLAIVDREGLGDVESLKISSSAVRSVAWGRSDETLFAGTYDGSVYIVDRVSGRQQRVENERAWPRSVSMAGDLLAVGSFTSKPIIYQERDGFTMPCSAGTARRGPNALAIDDGAPLVGTDSGEVIKIDLGRGAADRSLKVNDSPVLSLTSGIHGTFAGTYSGFVIRAEVSGRQLSDCLGAPIPSLAVIDGSVMAGTYGGELVELDPLTLRVLSSRHMHEGSIKSISHLIDDQFVTGATDKTVCVGGLDDRQILWRHGNLVNDTATLGGRVIASASRDRTVRVGRVERIDGSYRTGAAQVLIGPNESVKAVALLGTVDRPIVVAGSYDFGLYFWVPELDSDTDRTFLEGTKFGSLTQAISAITAVDEDTFVVAGWDRSITEYRFVDGTPQRIAQMVLGAEGGVVA